MNQAIDKHSKLLFLLVCIYPIYIDIYFERNLTDWFYSLTMQLPFHIILKKHEILAIFLYTINISFLLSIFLIASEQHELFKKIEAKYIQISTSIKIFLSAFVGTLCYLIPQGMDFIHNDKKLTITQSFIVGFLSILISRFILIKYKKSEEINDKKEKTIQLLIKILVASFCIYLYVKPTSIEGYKSKLSGVVHEADNSNFYKETMQLLQESAEDNAQLTEEEFMLLEPFRHKNALYSNSFGSVLSDLCTPQALTKLSQLTNRNYSYQLKSSIRHVTDLGIKDAEHQQCDAEINSIVFYNRIATLEPLLMNACKKNYLKWCQR